MLMLILTKYLRSFCSYLKQRPMKLFALMVALCSQILLSTYAVAAAHRPESLNDIPPNVLIILTDDQGLSDLGFYGNPSLETPNLDALARDSVRLEDFLASPTCSPTRAALLTGKHEFKVGITHTISGRSLLKPKVPTLPAHFQAAGYRTAIFGKWHLGETYPSRPQDRGFDEVFIHLGGGIGQTPDYWGNSYFDPHIYHNGNWQATDGYCTAVFSRAAWNWIDQPAPQPWLAYLSLNTPHTPLQIDDQLAQKYLDKGLPESQARFYAMIDDLDREVGAASPKAGSYQGLRRQHHRALHGRQRQRQRRPPRPDGIQRRAAWHQRIALPRRRARALLHPLARGQHSRRPQRGDTDCDQRHLSHTC